MNRSFSPPPGLIRLESSLLAAESQIGLLSAMQPLDFAAESDRAASALKRGRLPRVAFRYAPLNAEESQRAAQTLEAARFALSARVEQPWESIRVALLARIEELHLELRLVRERGAVLELASRRYAFEEALLERGSELARRWLSLTPEESEESDLGLASFLNRRAAEENLSIRVIEREMVSIAAVGGETLYVRRGARVSPSEAQRIWHHEVGAHLMPRVSASTALPLSRIGSSECGEDEEGRAVLLEERAGCLSNTRRRGLAVRHLLAVAVRAGDPEECALRLVGAGIEPGLIGSALCRVLRGAGLAREICYLPAYLRVKEALGREPALERIMERGRFSVSGALLLSSLFPELSRNQ